MPVTYWKCKVQNVVVGKGKGPDIVWSKKEKYKRTEATLSKQSKEYENKSNISER